MVLPKCPALDYHQQPGGTVFQQAPESPGTLFYAQDLSRPGFEDNFIDESLRLTWQAAAKHKIGVLLSSEDNCQCHAGQRGGTLSPEAAGDNHFSPAPRAQIKWTYPATNRLLFDAGTSALWGRWSGDRLAAPTPTSSSRIWTEASPTATTPVIMRIHRAPEGPFPTRSSPRPRTWRT